MFYQKDFRSIIVSWNNRLPCDRWWRQKYNIPFNSPAHRAVSQLDIYFEWVEEQTFKKYIEKREIERKEEEEFKKGIVLKERKEEDIDLEDLMKTADFSLINSSIKVED